MYATFKWLLFAKAISSVCSLSQIATPNELFRGVRNINEKESFAMRVKIRKRRISSFPFAHDKVMNQYSLYNETMHDINQDNCCFVALFKEHVNV